MQRKPIETMRPMFWLVRHAEPQYDLAEARQLKGGMRDWVPLTESGKEQAFTAAKELLVHECSQQILSSPMTRAVQTAAIIALELNMSLHVEFDLHEWLPDLTQNYDSLAFVHEQAKELEANAGEWPRGEGRCWEPLSKLRQRVLAVLNMHVDNRPVIVVCHGTVIQALTGLRVAYGAVVPYSFTYGEQDRPLDTAL